MVDEWRKERDEYENKIKNLESLLEIKKNLIIKTLLLNTLISSLYFLFGTSGKSSSISEIID